MRRNALLVLGCVVWFGLVGCTPQTPEQAAVKTLTITQTSGTTITIQAEIAATPDTQEHGLMGRQSLPAGHGMLFVFPDEKIVTFWMRNTPLFLDMVFFNARGEIVRIHPKARPYDDTIISSQQPARYVLEIAGGEAARYQLQLGDKLGL